MKREIFLVTVLSLFVFSVSGFTAEMEVVDRTAMIDDPAQFNLTVQNDYSDRERFRISSINTPPVASEWFEYEYSKSVDEGDVKGFLINVTPAENAIQQNYDFTANVRSFSNSELRKLETFFTVENSHDLRITSFEISRSSAEPGETVQAVSTVKNTDSDPVERFKVEVNALNQTVEREGTRLRAGDSIRYNFEIDVPNRKSPGTENINLNVTKEGESRHTLSRELEVQQIENISVKTSEQDRIITASESIELENHGNIRSEKKVERSIPVYAEPLTEFSAKPSNSESSDSSTTYTWNVRLDPGEKKQLDISTDYTPALGVIALVFLGVIGLKRLGSDISLTKNSEAQNDSVKITIELENSSGRELTDLKVKDFVPDIAEVPQDFEMAKPKVTKTNNGTKLEWSIDSIQPGEQRMLEYRIKPLVEVEDGITLSSATIENDNTVMKETSETTVDFSPN